MNKQTGLRIGICLVFLIVFNVIFFAVGGTEHPASVWLSYAFIHVAYIMLVATQFMVKDGPDAAVFGFSLYTISSVYFIAELIVGIVFILLAQGDIKAALIVQVVLFGAYLIMLLSHLSANERTAKAVQSRAGEIAYVKTAAEKLKLLTGKAADADANKAIEKAYDVVHASPVKSGPAVAGIELELLDAIDELESSVATSDAVAIKRCSSRIIDIANERNMRLRLTQ